MRIFLNYYSSQCGKNHHTNQYLTYGVWFYTLMVELKLRDTRATRASRMITYHTGLPVEKVLMQMSEVMV